MVMEGAGRVASRAMGGHPGYHPDAVRFEMTDVEERVEIENGLENIVNIHSTRVVDRGSGLTLELSAFPRASLPDSPSDLDGVADALGLDILAVAPSPAPSFLPHAVAALLISSTPGEAANLFETMVNTPPSGLHELGIDPTIMNFATYCSFAEIVGVEQSKMHPTALAAILTGAVSFGIAAMATVAGPVVVVVGAGIGTAAATVVVLSGAAALGDRIYGKIAPQ
jgi:hypothetical protein